MSIECQICKRECKNILSLSVHILRAHNISSKDYYDKYLKKENEGICKSCNNPTLFQTLGDGYRDYCSIKCSANDDNIKIKSKKTKLDKYGNENYVNIEKYKNTVKNKYGVINTFQLKEIKDKSKNTKKEKYGDENYSNRSKFKQTLEEKYDGNAYKIIREKTKMTKYKRYGDVNYNNIEKLKQTFEKVGITKPFEEKDKYIQYELKVRYVTNKYRKYLFDNWDGTCYYYGFKCDPRVPITKYSPIVEHKISIYYGYMNNIDPKIIGGLSNLAISSRLFNSEKRQYTLREYIIYRAAKILE